MKPRPTIKQSDFQLAVMHVRMSETPAAWLALAMAVAMPQVQASDGSWNTNAAGTWSTAGNWTPAVVPGTAAGDTVDLTFDISAARTVTIDTTSRTVGDLNIGDPVSAYFAYTLAATGGASLILDGAGTNPATVDIRGPVTGGVTNVISTPMTLADNAVFRFNGTTQQTISGVISDGALTRSVTFNNDVDGNVTAPGITQGQFSLSATTNTYKGGTFIDDVRVSTTTAGAFGTGAITVTGGGQVYFSGGTRTNSLVLNSTGWVETTGNFGALRIENATVSGAVTLQQNTTIGVNANNTGTLSGAISGAFDITKVGGTTTAGQGVLLLSGNNSGWSGKLTVDRGTVRLNNANALGTGTQVAINANSNPAGGVSQFGATLELAGPALGNVYGTGKTLTMTSGLLANNHRATLTNQSGSNTWAGAIVLDSAQPGGSLAQAQNNVASTTFTLSGPISATGSNYPGLFFVRGSSSGVLASTAIVNAPNTDLAKTDTGTWTINSTGNNWRNTIIADGTLALGANDALDPSAKLTLGQSSTTTGRFDLMGFNQTVVGLSSDPASTSPGHIIRNTGATASTLTTSNTGNDTFKGTLLGALSLVKNGTGTLNFNHVAANPPAAWSAGSIAVNEGTFNIATAGVIKLGVAGTAINVADGATLGGEGSLGGDLTLGTSNGANLVVNGGTFGALTVGGALTLNGTTQVQVTGSAGLNPIRVVNVPATPGGTGIAGLSVSGFRNPVFAYSDSPTPGVDLSYDTAALNWTGAGGGIWDVGTTPSWSNAPFTFYQGDVVDFGDLPGADQTVTVIGTVRPFDLVFSNSEAVPYTLTGTSGSAIESNLFIKAGTGTLVLAVDNLITSVSPINVIEGTLQLGNGGTTGTIGGDIINDASLVLNHGAGASVTVPGKISGLGSVTKIGAGTTILRGTSTYMGGTTVDGGVLDVAAAGAAGGGGITVASGTLRVSVANGTTAAQTITLGDASTGTATTVFELPVNTGATGDAVTLSTPLVVSSAAPDSKAILRYPGGTSGASMSYAGAITLQDRSLWIENTSDTNPITRLFNLTGQVSGAGDLCIDVPSPAARVRLSNTNNTFVGDVRLVRGMLQLGTGAGGTGNPIPDTANVIFSPGTRLGMGLSDTVGALVGGAADPGNALAAALINPNVGSAGTTTLTIGGSNQSGDFAGDITDEAGSHVMAIAKIGAGTQTLSGVSSIYTGSTTVSEGTLAVASVADNAGSIGKGSLILAGGTLSFTGSSQSSTARTLTVTAAGGTLDVAVATGELAFTGGGSVTGPLVKTGPGTASLAQPVTGSASVRVEGGTLVLDAACTYSGVTEIVSGGNLRLKGSLSGAVSVANSGVLSGTGVISGLATIANGGIIAPGNSPGRLTLAGGLSLTGTYLAEIATALSYDSLNITGNFAADGIIKVRLLDGFAPSENAMFDLADWTGTFSGAPVFDFSEAALTPGLSWDSSHFSSDGTLRVIPEPSIALLALGSGLIMLGRRRRGTVM